MGNEESRAKQPPQQQQPSQPSPQQQHPPSSGDGVDLPREESRAVHSGLSDGSKEDTAQPPAKEGKRQALRDLVGEVVSVVRHEQLQKHSDPALQALQETPQFNPLIKSRGFSFTSKSTLEGLDPGPVLRMCGRYQAFLKRSSLAVAQEQRVINGNLKRLENMSGRALSIFSQKANELKRFEMRFREVSQLEAKVENITQALQKVVETTQRLNARLPESAQLERLEFIAPRSLKRSQPKVRQHQSGCERGRAGEGLVFPCSGAAALQGKRYSMEDAHVRLDCIREGSAPSAWGDHWAFYAVYDGHGGSATAHYAAAHLHRLLFKQRKLLKKEVLGALHSAFLETDKQFCAKAMLDGNRSGSTAAVALLVGDELFIANAGDSEIILGSYSCDHSNPHYEPRQLTRNHKPEHEDERERIEMAGGGVFFGRVCGTLAVARALGDPEFKRPLNDALGDFVVPDPHLLKVDLTEADEFLILACDGLWDVFRYHEVVEYIGARRVVEPGITAEEIAKELANDAVNKRGSTDNVSVVIVFLRASAAQGAVNAAKKVEEEQEKEETEVEETEKEETATAKRDEEKREEPAERETENVESGGTKDVDNTAVVVYSPYADGEKEKGTQEQEEEENDSEVTMEEKQEKGDSEEEGAKETAEEKAVEAKAAEEAEESKV